MLKNGTRRYEKWWNAITKKQERFTKFLRTVLMRRGYAVQRTVFLGQEVGFRVLRQRLEPRHLEAAAYEYGKILCRCCGKDIITLEGVSGKIVDQMIPHLHEWEREKILIVANPNMKYGQIDTLKFSLNVGRITKFTKPDPKLKSKKKKKETPSPLAYPSPPDEWPRQYVAEANEARNQPTPTPEDQPHVVPRPLSRSNRVATSVASFYDDVAGEENSMTTERARESLERAREASRARAVRSAHDQHIREIARQMGQMGEINVED